MGRTGLRAILRWCVFFCAALATASIPVAFAQTRAPKIAPSAPAQNSALHSSKDVAPPDSPQPEEGPGRAFDLPAPFTPLDGLAMAGERGVTHPVCLRCPPAQYSYPALIRKIQGNVTMDAIISTDGWPSDVKILGSLGVGLDEQATKAVRTWQWEPARDADGKPVAAHQTVVITFRLPK